jgi:ABC-type glycerol-3-phosphate transport system substrate-binding protein
LLDILDEPEYESRASVAFAKEKAVFILEGPWALQNMITHNKNIVDDIGVTVLSNKTKGTVLGGRFLGIRSKSKNKETALEFIQYLVQEGGFFRRTAQSCSVPGIKNFVAEENILLQQIEGLLNQYGIIYPIRSNESEIWEELGDKVGKDLAEFIN